MRTPLRIALLLLAAGALGYGANWVVCQVRCGMAADAAKCQMMRGMK